MNYIHPTSQQKIDHYIAAPAQSTLIIGDEGIGFSGILGSISQQFGVQPYTVTAEKGTISAEVVRSLYDVTRGRTTHKQLIVIDDADLMSLTAQNAFLKLLEEPSPSIYFLLLSHNPSRLLPTIRSRVASIQLVPLKSDQSQQLLDELGVKDVTKRQQLLFIADGLPALLTKLAQDDALFETRAQLVRDARSLLQGTPYQKLKIAQAYKERATALMLLKDAARFLRSNATPANATAALKKLNSFMNSYERIEANGNVRLWLTMAVL
jgi:DNA polymerase III delta prime subunit